MSTRKKKTEARKQRKCQHEFEILEKGDIDVADICSETCCKCGYTLTLEEQQDMALLEGVFPEPYHNELLSA